MQNDVTVEMAVVCLKQRPIDGGIPTTPNSSSRRATISLPPNRTGRFAAISSVVSHQGPTGQVPEPGWVSRYGWSRVRGDWEQSLVDDVDASG